MTRSSIHTSSVILAIAILLVPALGATEIAGTWRFVFVSEGEEYPRTIVLQQEGENLTGKIGTETFTGFFRGNKLELEGKHYSSEAGYAAMLKFSGALESGRITGTGTWDTYRLTFEASKAD